MLSFNIILLARALAALVLLAHLSFCAQDYYKLLKITRSASDKEIKSAYRVVGKKYHPDKNIGDKTAQAKFVEASEAYQVLIDPETRKIYDQYGHDGVKKRQQGGGFQQQDPFDIFSRFFGGGGHFNHQSGLRRGPNQDVQILISLRDFYNGQQTEFTWEKQHICEECEGTGSKDRRSEICPLCHGHKVRLIRQQIAPGMIQQSQVTCEQCQGRGSIFTKPCAVCGGARVLRKPTKVTVKIPRGISRNSRIVFEDEADASPDHVAGDLAVILTEKAPDQKNDNQDHFDGAFFLRKGDDLHWREVLSVREAWMGDWSRNLTHLDGHIVRLGRSRGMIVQPGHVDTILNEGMPIYDENGDDVYHKTAFGKLYVEYTVVLPDQMSSGMEKEFWSLFQKWKGKAADLLHVNDGDQEGSTLKHEDL